MNASDQSTNASTTTVVRLATTNKNTTVPIGGDPPGFATTEPRIPEVPQYSKKGVLAVWAAAALPMGALAWVVGPAIAGHGASQRHFALSLITALTFGLVWQSLLVLILVLRESRHSPAMRFRDRLWLRSPSTAPAAADGCGGGSRPTGSGWPSSTCSWSGRAAPTSRDFGLFLNSAAGQGDVPPRLVAVRLGRSRTRIQHVPRRGAAVPRPLPAADAWGFRSARLVVNAFLFGFYHLHEPWVIPNAIVTGFAQRIPDDRGSVAPGWGSRSTR